MNDPFFDRTEQTYLTPPESRVIGQCDICSGDIHPNDWYEPTYNGLRHCDCKPKRKR